MWTAPHLIPPHWFGTAPLAYNPPWLPVLKYKALAEKKRKEKKKKKGYFPSLFLDNTVASTCFGTGLTPGSYTTALKLTAVCERE